MIRPPVLAWSTNSRVDTQTVEKTLYGGCGWLPPGSASPAQDRPELGFGLRTESVPSQLQVWLLLREVCRMGW